jgi:hypothetical protein
MDYIITSDNMEYIITSDNMEYIITKWSIVDNLRYEKQTSLQ